jgi:hypothetical protein
MGPWAIPGKGFGPWSAVPGELSELFVDHAELKKWVWANRNRLFTGQPLAERKAMKIVASNIGESGGIWVKVDDESDYVIEVMEDDYEVGRR